SLGVAKAGIYVDDNGDGIVFGDAKTFVSRHPYQTGMEIRYVSLEGPEAAAYHRGTATLVNGSAIVEFPEHFAAVINASGMTVQVTPLSANTPGLAVVEKSANRIVVKELQNGTGSFDFDFTITAVRKGFEDFEVVRPERRYDATPKYDPSLKIEQVKYRRAADGRSD
ncbi:MAG TPA: hypothetical protein VLB27_07475, partial [candidate division Zixibacteria bacterium]|nr:hypothetical protein [candidate division Zixibacteria bacterium]